MANELLFIVGDSIGKRKNTVYLLNDKWDDWFEYETQYIGYYINNQEEQIRLGYVKIAKKNQEERRAELPEGFTELGDDYFSLGGSEDYYLALKDDVPENRENILRCLNDIAFDLALYDVVKNNRVTQISLKRDITDSMIRGQLHRIATGGARLTKYTFAYSFPDMMGGADKTMDFDVIPESTPPTNIHAIIGKNGVGKTTLLKRMLYAVYGKEYSPEYGGFNRMRFSNVTFVSYSAFDIPVFKGDLPDDRRKIPYTFVGLIGQKAEGEKYVKDQEHLAKEFVDSLYKVSRSYRRRIWNAVIDILSSDMTFAELNIKGWIDNSRSKTVDSEEKDKAEFSKQIIEEFKKLSSGHKVILLTLTKLVELVEEKTLVILDEPEEHLHPPLVSAFIRALSRLLIYRNGVGIIATHSPVIVQEIPQKCVWMIRRVGSEFMAERPSIQTFGENLGELTEEIFGFEVLNSGFHKMLQEEASKTDDYEEALDDFDKELGKEARSLLKAYIYERNHGDD